MKRLAFKIYKIIDNDNVQGERYYLARDEFTRCYCLINKNIFTMYNY